MFSCFNLNEIYFVCVIHLLISLKLVKNNKTLQVSCKEFLNKHIKEICWCDIPNHLV